VYFILELSPHLVQESEKLKGDPGKRVADASQSAAPCI
jgi:hypothetical protein